MKVKIPVVKTVTYKEVDLIVDLSCVRLWHLFDEGEEIVADFGNGHLLVFNQEGASNQTEKEYNSSNHMKNFTSYCVEENYRTTRQEALMEVVKNSMLPYNFRLFFFVIWD